MNRKERQEVKSIMPAIDTLYLLVERIQEYSIKGFVSKDNFYPIGG